MLKFIYYMLSVYGVVDLQSDVDILNNWTKDNEAKLIQKYRLVESHWFEKECLKLANNLQFKHIKQCRLFDSNVINAYVFNNGHVYFSMGIMQKINNKHQWAAILAHENAHIVLHHYLTMLKKIKKPAVFFPKSKIRKMLKRHEAEADDWSQKSLNAHDMDYSQINYFLERVKTLKNNGKNNHLKLSKRIKETKNLEIMDSGLIQNINNLTD